MASSTLAPTALAVPSAPVRAADPPLWRDPLFGLALLLTAFAVGPFLLPGYFWGANDARHHVYFLYEYNRQVADGIWWPRWSPDFAFGYGYPFFNIYGIFSHFLAELLLRFGGLSYTSAVEAIFGLSIVASAAAMYVCVRAWGGRYAALVAAVVYTYLPYHLLNLYVRANLAESTAFVWLPLCLWAVRGAVLAPDVRRRVRWATAAALSYAGLMLTSNLVIVLFTPFLGLYLLLVAWLHALPVGEAAPFGRRLGAALRRALAPIAGLAAGLGLSAAFWIPAFLEQKYVRVDQWFAGRYDFRGHFVYFFQLFSPHWGFGVSTPGPNDPISYQIGAAALLLAVLGLIVQWRRAGRLRWELAYCLGVALLAVFFTLQAAAPLWELPLLGAWLRTAQFPWRWFAVMAPFLSMLGGLLVARFPARPALAHAHAALPALALCTVVILASYPYLRVQITPPAEGPVSLAGLMRFQQSSDEMTGSTAWVKEIPTWSPMADYYIQQQAAGEPDTPISTLLDYTVFDYKTFGAESLAHTSSSEEVYYDNRSAVERTLIFNQFYYPGWRAFLLDGEHGARLRELPIVPEASGTLGRMTVNVPPGEGYLLLIYGDTPPRAAGRWISWATLALLGAAAAWAFARPRTPRVMPSAAPAV